MPSKTSTTASICYFAGIVSLAVGLATRCTETIEIIGTGASSAASKMDALGHDYARNRNKIGRSVNFRYVSLSSRYALTQLMKNRTIDKKPLLFAVTTIRLSKQEAAEFPYLRMFPIMAWPMVIVYNLPRVDSLVLKTDHLPRMYSGNITMWNHPEILALNPGANIPAQKVIPVASAGDSGDARIITEAFSNFDTGWKTKYGTFTDPKFVGGVCCNSTTWPREVVHYFGKRSIGMIGLVGSIPYTIGYIASTFSTEMDVPSVSLVNAMGYRVPPTTAGVKSAVAYSKVHNPASLSFTLSNAKAIDAYPVVAFNYFVFNTSTTQGVTCCQMEELAGFVEWMLSRSGQFFEDQGAVSVTDHVADTVVRVILNEMRCNGMNSYAMYKRSAMTVEVFAAWKLAVLVGGLAVGCAIVSFVAFLILQSRSRSKSSMTWIVDGGEVRKASDGSSGSSVSFKSLSGQKAEYDHSPALLCELNVIGPTRWQKKTKKKVLTYLKNINHSSALQVLGITSLDGVTFVITELPGKGTLRHTLKLTKFDIHTDFKMAISMNLLDGLAYLHGKDIVHGLLNSETCYVNSSWQLKIGQWLDLLVYQNENPHGVQDLLNGDVTCMTDEELIRMFFVDPRAFQGFFDKSGDIFSLGLLVFEVFTFTKDSTMRTPEIIQILKDKYRKGTSELPKVDQEYPRNIEFLVRMCLGEPSSRPTIDVMSSEISKLRSTTKPIVDMLMETMEAYSAKLEAMVQERTVQLTEKTGALKEVTTKMEELLHEVLPPPIARKLLAGEKIEPEFFECVTIYFSDIVGFATLSSSSTPHQVMSFLNELWCMFDKCLEKYDVYKADTIGDAYMVCSGLPNRNDSNHVREICLLSIDLLNSCARFKFDHLPKHRLQIRIGINSGPVTTGVVGTTMPQYCVFGDAVNTASRMESTSEAMKIQVSQASHDLLTRHHPQFSMTYRGEIECKGKGSMKTYWLEPEIRQGGSSKNNPIYSTYTQ